MKNEYRLGVGIFLLNKNKKLWVGKRIDNATGNYWQMPQGGIDNYESFKDAMMRELKEEIGTNKIKILREKKELLNYDLPIQIRKKIWQGKYKGQSQKWFACLFEGKDKEININYFKPEFSEWKWINPNDALNFVIPFKKKLYIQILEEFKKLYC